MKAVIFTGAWLGGIVLAQGVLSTVVAVCIPPYAWYLVVERALMAAGWVGVQ